MKNKIPDSQIELLNPGNKNPPSRVRIAIEAMACGVIASVSMTIIQYLVWTAEEWFWSHGVSQNGVGSPTLKLWEMLVSMPIGYVIFTILLPSGWLFWFGVGVTVLTRRRRYMLFVLIGALWFGMQWPDFIDGAMGI